MTDENIFSSATTEPQVTPPVVSPQAPILPPEVADLVGTGKKYATTEDALKSVPHAQKHISTLELELAQAKQELEKRKTAEQLLEEIKQAGIPQVTTTAPVGLDQATVSQLIEQTINQKEAKKTADNNTKEVTDSFIAKYGRDKAEEFYINLAKETGMSIQNLNILSASSPSAVLKLAGLTKEKPSAPEKTQGSLNPQMFNNNSDPAQAESARVKQGASTKELVRAWKAAGTKVGKPI